VRTSEYRPDVCGAVSGASCYTGFKFSVPQSYHDGRAHSYYAYAINSEAGGENVLLSNSPRTFTCVPPTPEAPTCTLNASPSSVNQGNASSLSWTTSNASSVTIDQGVGSVAGNGSQNVSPNTTKTYTLTATGAGGSVTCAKTVTVIPPTPTPIPAPLCTFDASPASVNQGNASSLSWTTQNATSVTIDQGVGSVGTSDSRSITPSQTTTYTLTATGAGGTVTCAKTVTVIPQPRAPQCLFDVAPSTIAQGSASTLSWETQNATSVSINQNIGTVGANSSRVVNPTQTTTYTLTATGAGGTVTCTKTVNVVVQIPPPTCTLDANRTTINQGETTILTWVTTNATSVSVTDGIGVDPVSGSRAVAPSATKTYTLSATGAGGSVTCTKTVTVIPTPSAPTCALSASPTSINQGSASVLSWNTSNASTVTLSEGIGSVGISGSRSITPTVSKTYTLTATGNGGTVTCTQTVTVIPPQPVAPTCSFDASPLSINQGSASNLSWSTQNATAVTIDQGVGSVGTSGSRSVSPSNSVTYTLTATGAGGTVTCVKTVTVIPAPSAPTCTLSASPTSVNQGSASVLSWNTTNASSVTINNAVGTVAANGSKSISPSNSTTYTLTATGAGGTVTCSQVVTVIPAPSAPTCTLTASPTSVNEGNSSSLSWTTQNATSVSIDQGVGSVNVIGSRSVTPNATKTYTLTATGPGGTTTCVGTVTVIPAPSAPVCTLTASPASINQGSASSLSWTTQNATSVTIDQGVGALALNGSKNISPSNSTTYTLTATGAGGTATCVKTVTVIPTPSAPTCTLDATPTQLPYTGGTVSLSWTTQNASNVSISNTVGGVALSGSRNVSVFENTTFVLTVSGPGGTVTCSKPITLLPAPSAPTCTLDAAPAQITRGGTSVLTWTSQNASSVVMSEGIGSVELNGSKVVAPSATKAYTLTATGAGGTVICSKTVTVVVPPDAPTCTLTATPASVTRGGAVTLSWVTTNATAAVMDNGVGTVPFNGSKIVNPTANTEYKLSVVGDGGNVLCKTTVTVNEPPATPTCTLDANKTSLTAGESVLLTWNATNGTSATLQGNTVALGGSGMFTPATSTTYTYLVTGQGGTATCTKTITVVPYVPPAPACTLTLSSAKIMRGQSATLTWATSNTASAAIDQGVGAVTPTGSKVVNPTQTTAYTLTGTTAGGVAVTCVASLVVETEPEPTPLTCNAFSASPSTLNAPGTTTLMWNTTNATGVSINNGVGTTSVDGSQSVYVDATKTFTLTATDGEDLITCQTPVTITPAVIVPTCDAFTVSPTSVNRGENVTLTWNTTNATQVSINNGVGTVAADGSVTAAVTTDTTYTLTASNGSALNTCQTTVTIKSSGGGGGGGGSSSPSCKLTASDKTIKAGDKVTLTWKNQRTNDILLKDNRGNTILNSKKDDDVDEDAGSVVVRPTKSTSYTLTAIRGSKDRDCTVDINVSNVTVTSNRSQDPLVAGISLSHVPYTGFDAGPFLTSVFYGLLLLWGLGIAYVLVIKQSSVLGVSMNTARGPVSGRIMTDTRSGATPSVTSPAVRESIMGSVHVPMVQAPYALPVAAPSSIVGYEALYETSPAPVVSQPVLETAVPVVFADESIVRARLEERAHDAQVLISSDALQFVLSQSSVEAEQNQILDMIIDVAKATYPKEDGWITINKDRIMALVK
jgi:hypothetical protein